MDKRRSQYQKPARPTSSRLGNMLHDEETYEKLVGGDEVTSIRSSIHHGVGGGGDVEKAPAQGSHHGTTHSKGRIILIMTALCTATFLAAIDASILNPALPTITKDFAASSSGFAWIGSAFLLANATSMPFWGKISDIFGRKPILLLVNTLFLIGSVIGAVSTSLMVLLVGRVVQGLGAGGLMTLANVVISDLFSIRDRPIYYSIIGATWAFALTLGSIVGGVLTERASWRWCFWINVPCNVLSFILLFFFLDVHNPRTPFWAGLKIMDWSGAITISGGTVMVLLGLEFGGMTHPWSSPTVIALLVAGTCTWLLFGLIEWKVAKSPIFPLRIFRHRANAAIITVVACHGMAFMSAGYYLPFYFQAILGLDPIMTGVYFLCLAIPLGITVIVAGLIIKKTGLYHQLIIVSWVLVTLGYGLWTDFPAVPSWPRIVMYQAIIGVGTAALFQGPLIAFQANIKRPQDIAMGTSALMFTRMMTSAIGVVCGQVIFQSVMSRKVDFLLAGGVDTKLAHQLGHGGAVALTSVIGRLPPAQREVVREAIADALSRMWIFFAVVSGVGLMASLGIRNTALTHEHVEVQTGLQAMMRPDAVGDEYDDLKPMEKEGGGAMGQVQIRPLIDDDGTYCLSVKSANVESIAALFRAPDDVLDAFGRMSKFAGQNIINISPPLAGESKIPRVVVASRPISRSTATTRSEDHTSTTKHSWRADVAPSLDWTPPTTCAPTTRLSQRLSIYSPTLSWGYFSDVDVQQMHAADDISSVRASRGTLDYQHHQHPHRRTSTFSIARPASMLRRSRLVADQQQQRISIPANPMLPPRRSRGFWGGGGGPDGHRFSTTSTRLSGMAFPLPELAELPAGQPSTPVEGEDGGGGRGSGRGVVSARDEGRSS